METHQSAKMFHSLKMLVTYVCAPSPLLTLYRESKYFFILDFQEITMFGVSCCLHAVQHDVSFVSSADNPSSTTIYILFFLKFACNNAFMCGFASLEIYNRIPFFTILHDSVFHAPGNNRKCSFRPVVLCRRFSSSV